MATACITQFTFGFEPKGKPVVAAFDMPDTSTDGGAILLKGLDTQLQLTKRLAACFVDLRQPGKVQHQGLELFRQRIFGISCGYADCNDAARLADDAIHKLLLDRDPIAGPALASQPTLSRFENSVSPRELRDMAHVLADTVIEHHRRRLKGRATRITIDLDPTDDPTHGQQEFAFFNGHYDTWCYLPIVATVTFNDETEQFAVASLLRPGNAPATAGARGLLRRLLAKLRAAFPAAIGRVRLDGGFATPKMFTFLERQQVEYVVAMASNRRLEKRARRLMGRARMLSKASGQTEHLYGATYYAARKWKRRRRVIIKAEVVRHPGRDPKNNPRFVVTNLPGDPESIYHLYCYRGNVENRLKELHHGLELDRTSCSSFVANQFRVLLTLAAYILFQELRRRAAGTACADAQVTTLRERLLKLAVWVERSVRRVVLHLPLTFPWLPTWRQLARAVGATP
ncbi:MAG TPA: IS1380 family transposase [Candidatus Dormibacteraeota bacterium]|nr:IS1380 family transposase [Candidatus Dormibacteraeota bacterium]